MPRSKKGGGGGGDGGHKDNQHSQKSSQKQAPIDEERTPWLSTRLPFFRKDGITIINLRDDYENVDSILSAQKLAAKDKAAAVAAGKPDDVKKPTTDAKPSPPSSKTQDVLAVLKNTTSKESPSSGQSADSGKKADPSPILRKLMERMADKEKEELSVDAKPFTPTQAEPRSVLNPERSTQQVQLLATAVKPGTHFPQPQPVPALPKATEPLFASSTWGSGLDWSNVGQAVVAHTTSGGGASPTTSDTSKAPAPRVPTPKPAVATPTPEEKPTPSDGFTVQAGDGKPAAPAVTAQAPVVSAQPASVQHHAQYSAAPSSYAATSTAPATTSTQPQYYYSTGPNGQTVVYQLAPNSGASTTTGYAQHSYYQQPATTSGYYAQTQAGQQIYQDANGQYYVAPSPSAGAYAAAQQYY